MICENFAPSFRCVTVGTLPSTLPEKLASISLGPTMWRTRNPKLTYSHCTIAQMWTAVLVASMTALVRDLEKRVLRMCATVLCHTNPSNRENSQV